MLDDMPKYVPLEQRAVWLIDKGRAAWQEVQRVAMVEEELVDSASESRPRAPRGRRKPVKK